MSRRLVLPLLLLLTALVHIPVLGNEFAYDDVHIAQAVQEGGAENPMVARVRPLGDYFAAEYWTATGQTVLSTNPLYRPLTVLSFALTHAAVPGSGTPASEAFPHHLVNLLLQLLAVVLVFRLVVRAGASELGGALAAAVFAVHALHTEVVASCVGRADLFALCFGALGLLVWSRAFGSDGEGARSRAVPRVGLAAVLLMLGFLSKESALAWVGFFPIFGVVAAGFTWRQALVRTLAVAGVPIVLWWLLRAHAFRDLPGEWQIAWVTNPIFDAPALTRVLTATKVWGHGLLATFLPLRLASDWGANVFTLVDSVADAGFLAAVLGLGLAGGAALWFGRGRPLILLAGVAWFGFSVLTANLLFPIGTMFGERLYYMASLGLAFLVAGLATMLRDRPRALRVTVGIVAVWVAGNGVRTFLRCGEWRNDSTLFEADVRAQPRSLILRLQNALAIADPGARERYLTRLVGEEPEFARAWIELGRLCLGRQAVVAAQEAFDRALAANIIYRPIELPIIYYNRGVLALLGQRGVEAQASFQKAIDLAPRDHLRRGQILAIGVGSIPDAVWRRWLADGERLAPDDASWRYLRGVRAFRARDYQSAVDHWSQSIQRVPASYFGAVQAWVDYAQALARVNRVRDAVTLLQSLLARPEFKDPGVRKEAADMLRILRGG